MLRLLTMVEEVVVRVREAVPAHSPAKRRLDLPGLHAFLPDPPTTRAQEHEKGLIMMPFCSSRRDPAGVPMPTAW